MFQSHTLADLQFKFSQSRSLHVLVHIIVIMTSRHPRDLSRNQMPKYNFYQLGRLARFYDFRFSLCMSRYQTSESTKLLLFSLVYYYKFEQLQKKCGVTGDNFGTIRICHLCLKQFNSFLRDQSNDFWVT